MIQLSQKVIKNSQEMYDFVNVRLNEYVRVQQFHEFKQTLLEYTLQKDFDDVKDKLGTLIR